MLRLILTIYFNHPHKKPLNMKTKKWEMNCNFYASKIMGGIESMYLKADFSH
jgi:hypothetical protein